MNLNKVIKNTLRKQLGLEVRRYVPASSPTAQIVSSLRKFEIDLVLDVGANEGQFASAIRNGGYSGDIVSFEPLSSAHYSLEQLSKGDEKWQAHSRCALGDRIGEVEINIAGNSASSSLLPMLDSHISAAPHTAYVGKETVPQVTLDSVAAGYIAKSRNPFLKIDTQGFEWAVLDGSENVLPQMRGVLLELSLIPLYEGQRLWQEVIGRLEREGFVLWALQPGFTDPNNGRTLQVDGIFFRVD
ncbi:MAG: FkbM family methyltransferase [Methylococcales bacterium]|nr:FkbM family methyltransferase [Methylococcales bacterium]